MRAWPVVIRYDEAADAILRARVMRWHARYEYRSALKERWRRISAKWYRAAIALARERRERR